MQLKFFTFSIFDADKEEENINKFLRSVRVLEIKREILSESNHNFWSISIVYLPSQINEISNTATTLSKNKVDYKEILSEEEFRKFCNYRKLRKQIADNDAVPAFAVFTDYELSEITKLEVVSEETLSNINGIGKKKIAKYGKNFCDLINNYPINEEMQ